MIIVFLNLLFSFKRINIEFDLTILQISKFQEPNRAQPLDWDGAIRIPDGNLNHNGGSNLTSANPCHKHSTDPHELSVLQTKCLYLLHTLPPLCQFARIALLHKRLRSLSFM